MATICCIHGIETGHHYCRECADMAADIEWSHRRISELEAELAKAKLELQQEAEADIQTMATIKNIEADNSHLRSCLKRLEWLPDEKWATETCYACGFSRPTHNAGCWLKLELEGQ